MNDPIWFWQATFTDLSTMTFWNDSKALAYDHAAMCGREFGKTVKTVKRVCHDKDVTAEMRDLAGAIRSRTY